MGASDWTFESFPVVVVGGGQAGLAVSYYLTKTGIRHVILDAQARTGDSWRTRWPTLKLFTPARLDGLPGMRFPARAGYLPSKDEMADYLAAYAERFRLPVRNETRVTSLTAANGRYLLGTTRGEVEADQVIVATGNNQTPRIPAFAAQLDPTIKQLSAADYHDPSQLNPGPVLVVGAANSGAEIALEAIREHPTWLSGRDTGIGNRRVFSRPLWWIGLHFLTRSTPQGRQMIARMSRRGAALQRIKPSDLSAAGIERVAITSGVKDGKPELAGGRVLDVRNVVWCTGFDQDFSWIRLPIFSERGEPDHWRGVARALPGLYFVGSLRFLYGITSGLVGGVSRDADYVATMATRSARLQGTADAQKDQPSRGGSAIVDTIVKACVANDPTVYAYFVAAVRQESAPAYSRRLTTLPSASTPLPQWEQTRTAPGTT